MHMAQFIPLSTTLSKPMIFDTPGLYVIYFHNLSGTLSVELNVPGVHVEICGVYTGHERATYSVETIQRHNAPETYSNLFIKGVFFDHARFHYQGLIRIEKTGNQSHAYQKNQNLILSPHAYVESMPFLEILANDVFCTHGSTTGRLNKDEILYARSRGISTQQARQLLIAGFVGEVHNKVQSLVPDVSLDPLMPESLE